MGSIPGLGRSEMATRTSILAWKNPMDTGARWAAVHRVRRIGHDPAPLPSPFICRSYKVPQNGTWRQDL